MIKSKLRGEKRLFYDIFVRLKIISNGVLNKISENLTFFFSDQVYPQEKK